MKLYQLLAAVPLVGAALHTHDSSFEPDYVLRVTSQNVSIGGIERFSTLVNGSIPGPEIRLPENKVVWIRVYNDMSAQNLTMHWHGLAQMAYPFSDGTPLASQWPIPALHYFDYEIQTANGSAGTYFYHSHVDFQATSASGPLIIEDSGPPPYPVDGERVLHIQELFNETDQTIITGLQSIPFVWSGETNGFMINGDTISNYGVTDPSSKKLSVITVDPDNTYRFRYIAATTLSYASLAFENHTQYVIEADGGYTKSLSTNILQLGQGQRFSTLFQTMTCDELKKAGKLDYYMQIESRARPTVVTNYAILRYSNTCGVSAPPLPTNSYPAKKPFKLPPIIQGFLDYQLQPLQPNDFPSASEVTRRVIVNVQQVSDKYIAWEDDGITWVEDSQDVAPHTTPQVPYLVALYQNETQYLPSYSAAIANGGFDPKTHTFPAKIGEVLEIVLQNIGEKTLDGSTGGGLDLHPWHAHGRHYYDIGGGPGTFNATLAEEKLQGTHPIQRDTTMLYRYNSATQPNVKHGWRAWRLRIQDPGVWMVHCHTLQHMVMGMQTVWVFGDAKDIKTVGYPDVQGYLTYGGNVNGNSSHHPTVYHFSEDRLASVNK